MDHCLKNKLDDLQQKMWTKAKVLLVLNDEMMLNNYANLYEKLVKRVDSQLVIDAIQLLKHKSSNTDSKILDNSQNERLDTHI